MKRLGCAAALFVTVVGLPFLAIMALWMIGGGNHRSIEHRLLSPDGRHEVRVQNDVRGSIQPIEWVVYVKPAASRSDDPDGSCAVADVLGEDGWRAVEPRWRGATLELRSHPEAASLPLRRPLAKRASGCSLVPVRLISARR